jgi:hypothetical protein
MTNRTGGTGLPHHEPEPHQTRREASAEAVRQEQGFADRPLCRRNDICEYPLGDEMVLYWPTGDRAFSLNSSARAVWELCDGRHSVPAITDRLAARFGSPREALEILQADIDATIRQLYDSGLLEAH